LHRDNPTEKIIQLKVTVNAYHPLSLGGGRVTVRTSLFGSPGSGSKHPDGRKVHLQREEIKLLYTMHESNPDLFTIGLSKNASPRNLRVITAWKDSLVVVAVPTERCTTSATLTRPLPADERRDLIAVSGQKVGNVGGTRWSNSAHGEGYLRHAIERCRLQYEGRGQRGSDHQMR
jgi:hypothetical protein